MGFLRQLGMLLRMNLLGLPQRLGLVCITIISVTCAVGVLVSMLAMGVGARRAAMGNVRADRASVLSVDAVGPGQSSLPKDIAVLIKDLPGIRRNSSGQPIAVPEVSVFVEARRKDSGNVVGFPMIGAGAGLTDYAPELHLTAGRMFRPGLREIIASNYCAHQYQHFNVEDKRVVQGVEWLVVGSFDLGREAGSCLVYADADTVLSAFRRSNYNQLNVMLQSPAAFDELVNSIKGNPQLQVKIEHEGELAEAGVQEVNGILNFVSYVVGAILAVAAMVGAANSMYAVVDSRRLELATLRAIGFQGGLVAAAILAEAMVWALPGALIGAGLAWLFFNGYAANTFGFQFQLAVTTPLALFGIGWALGIGLIGGLLPAARAARVPVTAQLRAT